MRPGGGVCHLRLCRHGHGGERKGSLCAGGVRYPGGGQPSGTGDGRYHRIGRRGCQDPLSDQRYGGSDERFMRRRHRGLHRPDGHAAENERGGDGQSRPDSGKDLHHRRPLRRVCQERHPAPHQSGGQVRRHRQEHLSGGGESDHRGSGAGTAYQGPRSVSGRAADLFQVSAAELRRDLGRHRNLSGEQPAVCGSGRGVLRRGIVGPAENGGAVGAARHVGDLPLPAAPL